MTTFDLDAHLAARRTQIDAALDTALPKIEGTSKLSDDKGNLDPGGPILDGMGTLTNGMRYAVLQGGKRMRPVLTLCACEAVGGSIEQAMPAACALEMIHAYSLVHDDLPAMDDDVERRGRPTVHVAFGEPGAVLVGDALLTRAFELVTEPNERVDPVAALAATRVLGQHAGIRGMVGGQGEDLVLGQGIEDLKTLEHVHALKTGGLYAAAGAMGALCGGADAETVKKLEEWGLCFGIAFQHADDVLDDDQEHLRAAALQRVDELVARCRAIAAELGPRAQALDAIAEWVARRSRKQGDLD